MPVLCVWPLLHFKNCRKWKLYLLLHCLVHAFSKHTNWLAIRTTSKTKLVRTQHPDLPQAAMAEQPRIL